MKHLLTVFLALISISCVWGQLSTGSDGDKMIVGRAKVTPLDKSVLACVYSHKIFDPIQDESREKFYMLQIGTNFSKYFDYGAFQYDSIRDEIYKESISQRDFDRLCTKCNYPSWFEFLIKDLREGSLTNYGKVFMDRYSYKEDIPPIKWKLENEVKKVCGHTCKKATAQFRGREWTAWYSDIPLNNGPWKFGNLPGLILRVEDSKGEHIFEAVSIRKKPRNFGYVDYGFEKTTRTKFNTALSEYKNNPGAFFQGTAYDRFGNISKPVSRIFFNPIELE